MTDSAPRPTRQASPDRLAMLGGARAVPRTHRIPAWPLVTDADREAVLRSLSSGRFTTAAVGEREIESLEREWAERTGTRHCVMVSNGTAALSVALGALGVEPGDEVIVPALSFIASAVAPLHVLAVPVFVDIDPRTYNMVPELIEAAITPRTRAVVVVHLHGLPAEMDEIRAVADRHGLAVVEDAAQAHGAAYRGRTVGSIGEVNTFSLNVSKNLATCGEGGLITTDDDGVARRAAMLRQFGEVATKKAERSYVGHLLGFNHKPNAIQAAFTRSRLERFDEEAKLRDENVRRFLGRLAALPGLLVPEVPDDRDHAWHILRFRTDPGAWDLAAGYAGPLRAALMRALRAEGVPAGHYQMMSLPQQRVFRERLGFGGLPWQLPGVAPRAYRAEDQPTALAVIDDSFTLQKAHLSPSAGPLLSAYADAFEKVWAHRDVVARHAVSMEYRTPWETAEGIAADEWTEAAG
ncbi:DegT/DnrJ/EryC1/StrS family aminotransferase [Streptomyces sp. SID8352]|uniref:DegT/DnrJ/EryC1/StrS family aminotransferase n=1 Tax=Streptomyces sp. SID8352 TaxID=2690338 RepID=UPI0013683A99|nr:DegT/DnrJ/EryC1/StrS family aminotransferase [Streptomyces sp. SID8352]MYU20481.1 aminotransferase class V-fold PLP-dependent enzyme [Streptomyces sp. SID8352]